MAGEGRRWGLVRRARPVRRGSFRLDPLLPRVGLKVRAVFGHLLDGCQQPADPQPDDGPRPPREE